MTCSPVPLWRKLLLLSLMESPDLVSVSRRVSRPIFASLGLGLEGFRSRDFEYCKEMFCSNFYNSTIFCLLYLQEIQPKHVAKMPEIWRIFKSEVMTIFFQKIWQNAQSLKSRVSVWVSNFKSRASVSVSGFLVKSRSRLQILTRSWSRSRRFQVSRLRILQRNGLLKFL